MKIYDCFMYYDEDLLLDLRLNYLNEFVDKFVIVESKFSHKGEKRKLLFDINNYSKFRDKITYIKLGHEPPGIKVVNDFDNKKTKSTKYIMNAVKRENYQRNFILNGITQASPEDIILISDVDEIPNLEKINIKNIKSNLIFFKQDMYYYKFNLKLKLFPWVGTKACRKKDLVSPQWLRNIKDKSYPFWRIDTFFSKKKYQNLSILNDGGWHFSCLKNAADIEKKLKNYLHHHEYDLNPLGINKINQLIKDKKAIYNLKTDMRRPKFEKGENLTQVDLNELPSYIQNNKDKYKLWLE